MFSNYIKIAWRNLWKHKLFAAIVIFGMAIAFTASLLLSLTAYHELSYDQFHTHKKNLYQLYFEAHQPDKLEASSTMPIPLAPALKAEYPDIQYITRFGSTAHSLVRYHNKEADLNIRAVDPDFLQMFTFPLTAGNAQAPLNDLNNVVITEHCARVLFNNEDPVGKTIEMKSDDTWKSYTVTAVAQDLPDNSSLTFDILARFEHFPAYRALQNAWDSDNHEVFVQLRDQTTRATFEKQSISFIHKYYAESLTRMKRDGAKPGKDGELLKLRAMPFSDIHFREVSNTGAGVNRFYPYLLLIISAFILFIACVNFVNLSLARSFTRSKEIGIRKVMGARRWQLISQFWGEALIVCLLALLCGLALAWFLLPWYKQVFYQAMSIHMLRSPLVIVYIVTGFLLVTLFAGGYPAWMVSAFKTIETVKGKLPVGRSHRLRNTLMTVQFILSSLLIICTMIIWQQLHYLRTKPLGYNKEQVISLPVGSTMDPEKTLTLMRHRLAKEPRIVSITGTDMNLGRGRDGSSSTSIMGFDYKNKGIKTHWLRVDYDYLKTMDIQLLSGRDFSRSYGMDTAGVLINETMARQLGEKDPLTAVLDADGTRLQVLGVVKDFHFKSLHRELAPLTMVVRPNWPLSYLFIRVQPNDLPGSIEVIKKAWKEVNPKAPFLASFLDENIDRSYNKETRLSKIFISGAILAILISAMGLFAMALLAILQRTKEIGIRKVLGASVPHIVVLVSRDFLVLVLVAIVIASPIAWYAMNNWLQSFYYRISISWWVFALAGVIALLIAFVTLSLQSVKAALRNPVNSLRSE